LAKLLKEVIKLLRKILKLTLVIALGLVWLFFAVGFGYFGLFGFLANASEKGFRTTLCGSIGCSELDYFFSIAWVAGMICIVYILPIALIIYLVHKRRKGKRAE
jgi:threonine/homoserine/homoserine lactone efflux protein